MTTRPDREPDPSPDDQKDAADGHGPVRPPEVATDADRDAQQQEQLVDYAHRLGRDPSLADLDDGQLEDAVRCGASALAAATCTWLVHLAELVVRGVWAVDGATTPATWLSWAVGLAPSTAREHLRVALRLRDCPRVRQRFAEGRISYSKVRAITRIATPDTEAMLLDWADAAPAAALERICADTRRLQRAAAAPAERDDLGLTARWREDNTLEVTLLLDAASGVGFEQHLDRLAELDSAPDHTGDAAPATPTPGDVDPGGPRPAAAAATDDPPVTSAAATTTATTGRVPRRRRRADLLLGALSAAVATAPADSSGLDRHTVVLHAPAQALADPGGPAVLVRDGRGRTRLLPNDALTGLACTATLGVVADPDPAPSPDHADTGDHDDDDQDDVQAPPPPELAHPEDLGRRRREPSMRLRRALWLRDRTCRFPGCGATLFLHAHHVRYWSDGGRTDMANLLLLCRHHHDVVHHLGWTLRADGPGRWTFHPAEDAPALPWSRTLRLTGSASAEPDGRTDAATSPVGENPAASAAAAVHAVLHADRHLADPRALLPVHWDGRPHDHDLVMGVVARALDIAA